MSFSFGTNRVPYVADSRSQACDASCVESFKCTWATRYITSASASPLASPPARCRGTLFNDAPLLLGTFLLPLNCACPVWCPPQVAATSFIDCSVKALSSINGLISSGISTFVMLARMHLCQEAFVQMFMFQVPSKQTISLKREREKKKLWVKTCRRRFCFRLFSQVAGSDRLKHKTSSTSKCLHYMESGCNQIRNKTVSRVGHTLYIVIVVTYSFHPCPKGACTSCATIALCVSKVPCTHLLLSSICTGKFCAFLFSL